MLSTISRQHNNSKDIFFLQLDDLTISRYIEDIKANPDFCRKQKSGEVNQKGLKTMKFNLALTSKNPQKSSQVQTISIFSNPEFDLTSKFTLSQIEIESEIDLGNFFYTVRCGTKALGVITRPFESDIYQARAFYHNPNNVKTQHRSQDEAIGAIVGSFTGKVVLLPTVKPSIATYHLTLETIELDELGIPTERRVVVKKNPDIAINWHLWAIEYSQLLGEPYRLSDVVRVDNSPLTEF